MALRYGEASEIEAWHHYIMLSSVTTGSFVYVGNFSGLRLWFDLKRSRSSAVKVNGPGAAAYEDPTKRFHALYQGVDQV